MDHATLVSADINDIHGTMEGMRDSGARCVVVGEGRWQTVLARGLGQALEQRGIAWVTAPRLAERRASTLIQRIRQT